MKAIILKGIPWSWKSTIAKQYIDKWYVWVNWDSIRLQYPERKESLVKEYQNNLVTRAYKEGNNIVWDNTFINTKTLELAKAHCEKLWYEIELRDTFAEIMEEYDMSECQALQECLNRNTGRVGKSRVPESVIMEMYLKDWYKISYKTVVLVDLDGTLYNMDHRAKYTHWEEKDWSKFESNKEIEKDMIYEPISDIIKALDDSGKFYIMFVSGRKDHACQQTIKNLKRDGFDDILCGILMRHSWDSRKDDIVKWEFLDLILKNHTVAFVIDDRKQVIDMWRKRWLYVLNASQKENNDF